jgi:hypothetical protein
MIDDHARNLVAIPVWTKTLHLIPNFEFNLELQKLALDVWLHVFKL